MPNKLPAARRLYRLRPEVTSSVVLNAGVGLFFSLTFFLVFIPQHLECYKRKTCAGLSPYLLLFGGISFMFAFYNVLLMDIDTLGACHGDEVYDPEAINCIAVFSPILQQALPAITGYPSWYVWYHLYCPPVLWKTHVMSLTIFLAASGMGAVISLYVLFLDDHELTHLVGTVWGLVATITNFIMWFPQIETTLRLQSRGALSIYTLVSTVISDILFTLYLVVMARQHWSVWMPQVPDAFQQMLILGFLWHFGELSFSKKEPNPISTRMLSSSTFKFPTLLGGVAAKRHNSYGGTPSAYTSRQVYEPLYRSLDGHISRSRSQQFSTNKSKGSEPEYLIALNRKANGHDSPAKKSPESQHQFENCNGNGNGYSNGNHLHQPLDRPAARIHSHS
ncbi:hypothetical protein AAMO2058_001400600 [Amorphochlora amoebiformis]